MLEAVLWLDELVLDWLDKLDGVDWLLWLDRLEGLLWLEELVPDWLLWLDNVDRLDRLEDELDMLTWPQTGCSQGYSIHNSSSLTTRLPGLWS